MRAALRIVGPDEVLERPKPSTNATYHKGFIDGLVGVMVLWAFLAVFAYVMWNYVS